jgi:Ca2+-binding RTX toxin-like protein
MSRFIEKKCSWFLAISFLLSAVLSSPTIVISAMAAVIDGTDSDNSLYGTLSDDTIKGKGENDNLYGNGGDDGISGGSGDDFIQGDADNDNLKGDDGNDYVQGGSGIDTVNGGPGNDTLISSFVTASMTIRDFEPDSIICGDGFDTAFINLADNDTASSDCEIIVSTPSTPSTSVENRTVLDGNHTESSITVSNQTLVFPLA